MVRTNGKTRRSRSTARLLSKRSSAGLPLGRFYPELKDCMLLCATEMSKRSDMDAVAAAFTAKTRTNDQESLQTHCSRTSRCCSSTVRPASAAISFRRWMCLPSTRRSCWATRTFATEIEDFPEVSEFEALRHFTRLSTWNYAIDLGLYPLGSCTMKYNPRVNELVARTEGLAWAHPYQPEELAQGCMEVIAALGAGAGRDHRHGCRDAAAGGRRARRVHRHSDDPRAA